MFARVKIEVGSDESAHTVLRRLSHPSVPTSFRRERRERRRRLAASSSTTRRRRRRLSSTLHLESDDEETEHSWNVPSKRALAMHADRTRRRRLATVSGSGSVLWSQVSSQCTANDLCEIPAGLEVTLDSNMDVGALLIKGVSGSSLSILSPSLFLSLSL